MSVDLNRRGNRSRETPDVKRRASPQGEGAVYSPPMEARTKPDAMVFVVDDDAPMRESLKNLIRSVGLWVEAFASAQEFLRSTRPEVPSCLVLDVRLPGLSGLDLQRQMAEGDRAMPIIFITGHGDIPSPPS